MYRVLRTLRFRLAVWNAVVVILTSVVMLLGLRQGVRWTLLNELDQILLEDIQEIQLALEDLSEDQLGLLAEDLERKSAGHEHHGWFVELHEADGEVLWQSAGVPTELAGIPLQQSPPVPAPVTVKEYRLVERRASSDSKVDVIRVGASLGFLKTDMARLDRLMMLASCCLLVAAPLVGYFLARRAARTMGVIIQTASRLRPDRLEERLPIEGTGDELDQLAAKVNDLLDRIATYLQDKRDLLANAAHELRTPLAAIRSSVEVALSEDRTPEEYQRLLEDVIEEGSSLETLVNQLLLLSETEADRFKTFTETVPLHDVVRNSLSMFEGVAETRQVTLTLEQLEEAGVPGYRPHLRQVVNNLLDNAIKYTPAGGEVHVSLQVRGSWARLVIRDTGIGISQEDLPQIFDRFFRADRSRLRHGIQGTGLGLSICKAVVTAHRGKISCESTLDGGTTMTVDLPLETNRS